MSVEKPGEVMAVAVESGYMYVVHAGQRTQGPFLPLSYF